MFRGSQLCDEQTVSPSWDQILISRQLAPVLQYLFNLSLHLETIPVLWKTSCIVPVPKKTTPSGLNDYCPVALTSPVMKVLERLVLAHLSEIISRSSAICLPASPGGGRCHYLPAAACSLFLFL